jgi:hypothetical protein
MADLKEKGRKFTSDFLILTSNYPESSFKWANTCVSNKDAFFRRIYPAYEIFDFNKLTQKYRIGEKVFNDDLMNSNVRTMFELTGPQFVKLIVERSMKLFRQRAKYDDFVVPVTVNGPFKPNLGFKIPINPPERLPIVKAHAIPEPLKVRMITKAEEECWVLKPVQKAMWRSLQHFKCFHLTGSPDIPLEWVNQWSYGPNWLSGDYESATDNLNQDIMKLAVEELSKVIPSPYKEWMEFESQPHIVKYPSWTNQPDIIQTKGQLMGSLLSFPVLCVANAACIGIIKRQELNEIEALINGDDILFRESLRKIESWKRLTKSVGLKPSVGKNYSSPDFCSINSQLLTSSNGKLVHRATGCFGAVEKVSSFVGNLAHALRIEPQNLSDHIHRAKILLRRTPQSLKVPIDFGGLGIEFHYPQNQFEVIRNNEIYFFKLLKNKCSILREIDDDLLVRVPRHLFKKYQTVIGSKPIKEVPELELEETPNQIFDYRGFRKFQKWYKTVPYLRERVSNAHLPKEIPLKYLSTTTVLINRSFRPLIQNLHLQI